MFPAVGSTPLKWTTSYSSETSVCVPFWFLEHTGWSLLLHNLSCAQWIPWGWLMNALVYGSDFIHKNILIGTDIITFWRMSQGTSIHAGPLKVNLRFLCAQNWIAHFSCSCVFQRWMPQTDNCLGKECQPTYSNLYGHLKTPATNQFGTPAIITEDTIHLFCMAWSHGIRNSRMSKDRCPE